MTSPMTDETLIPIAANQPDKSPPSGRRADLFAAALAALGALLSCVVAIWFFAGFAENDTRPEHLASALSLTLILFAFAIIPFALVAWFARRAYRLGTTRAHLLWSILLMLPWIVLGSLAVSHTPLPIWGGLLMAILAGLLTLWALVSLILDRNTPALNTQTSHRNEMPEPSE